jgi:hypothetical protein
MFGEMSTACWLLIAVEVVGLGSAWAARLSLGSPRQARCHWVFLGCLAMVTGASFVALGMGPACWLTSGVTIAGMILTVTCDFSRSRPGTVW